MEIAVVTTGTNTYKAAAKLTPSAYKHKFFTGQMP